MLSLLVAALAYEGIQVVAAVNVSLQAPVGGRQARQDACLASVSQEIVATVKLISPYLTARGQRAIVVGGDGSECGN